jgi:chemotaxis protein CheD
VITSHENPAAIYLKSEEMAFCASPTVVNTVLGSCVSITMHHPRSGLGAICHAFMPQCPQKRTCRQEDRASCLKKYTYVDCVIPRMMNRFRQYGYNLAELEIKVFGGANSNRDESVATGVGHLNILEAMKVIDSQSLWPKAADVGGRQGRKIRFFSHTGEVLLKRL